MLKARLYEFGLQKREAERLEAEASKAKMLICRSGRSNAA
jgi:hypothetical protein